MGGGRWKSINHAHSKTTTPLGNCALCFRAPSKVKHWNFVCDSWCISDGCTLQGVMLVNGHCNHWANSAFSQVVLLALADPKNWILSYYPDQSWILSHYPSQNWILSQYPSQNWILSFYPEKALWVKTMHHTYRKFSNNMITVHSQWGRIPAFFLNLKDEFKSFQTIYDMSRFTSWTFPWSTTLSESNPGSPVL